MAARKISQPAGARRQAVRDLVRSSIFVATMIGSLVVYSLVA